MSRPAHFSIQKVKKGSANKLKTFLLVFVLYNFRKGNSVRPLRIKIDSGKI